MSFDAAQESRRSALPARDAGFTLIELLVVVIIIGILAAIAIPVYLAVQNGAKEAATKADLTNAKTALSAYGADHNGNLPASISDDAAGTVGSGAGAPTLDTSGWSKSPNTSSLVYVTSGSGASMKWCITGTSSTSQTFTISSKTAVAPVTCTALGAANY